MNQDGLNILLIDDNPHDRLLISRELRKIYSNLFLVQITDPTSFENALEDGNYDLVITDFHLNWSDGISVLRAIKAQDPDCPVIMFTGTGNEEIAVEAMKAGLDDYILKSPRHFGRLPGAVRVLIERVRQQHSFLKTESRYLKLIEGIPLGLYRTNPEGIILDANSALVEMLGCPDRATLLNLKAIDFFVTPEDRQKRLEQFQFNNKAEKLEFQLRRFDNQLIWVEDNSRAIYDETGGLVYYEGSLEDITDRKQTEEALRRSEDRFRSILESIDDIVWEMDEYKVFSYISPKIYQILGYLPDEIMGQPAAALNLGPEADELYQAYYERTLGRTYKTLIEGRFIHKVDQHRVVMETSITPIVDGNGVFRGIRGVCRDVTEKRSAEKRLLQTASELQAIFQAMPDMYFRLDPQGILQDYKTNQVEELYLPPDQFLGKSLQEVLPLSVATLILDSIQLVLQTGQLQVIEYSLPKNGRLQNYEARLLPVLENQVFAFVRNITERKQAEERLHRREAILRAMGTAAEQFLKTKDWKDCIQFVLKQFGEATGVSRVSIYQKYTESSGSLQATRLFAYTPIGFEPHTQGSIPATLDLNSPEVERLARSLKSGEIYQVIPDDAPEAENIFWKNHQIQTNLVIPIHAKEDWWGFLGFEDYQEKREWSPTEVDALRGAASILGAAIQHYQMEAALQEAEIQFRDLVEQALVGIYAVDGLGRFAYINPRFADITGYPAEELIGQKALADIIKFLEPEALTGSKMHAVARAIRKDGGEIEVEIQGSSIQVNGQPGWAGTILDITERKYREQEMQAILTISSALRSASTRAEMLTILLDQIMELLKVKAALLLLRDPAGSDLVVEMAHGAWSGNVGDRLELDVGITGQVMQSGLPYVSNLGGSDPLISRPDQLAGIQTFVVVPLIAQKQSLGVLWTGCNTPFTDEEVRLMVAIGEIAANAIHRTTLHEQTELRLQRLTALRAIDMAITASLDVRVTLSILLGQVTAQLGVHAAGVMLVNSYTQMLEYAAIRGFRSTAIQRIRQRLGEGYAGKVAVDRKPLAIHNLAEAEGYSGRDQIASEGFQTYYAAPLIAKGQVKGVLEVFHREEMHPDPEWMDFLQAIAAQAAIAVDNAELFDRLQHSNIELTLAYDATIEGWARAMEIRDRVSESHIQNMIDLTIRLARAAGIPETEAIHIRRGVLLHDIGRMAIPDQIIFKPGPLNPQEWEGIRCHPQYAYELLSPIPYLRPALDIPYCHHERWDGSGYPRGLKGEQIPLAARVFSIVDIWDSLQSERPYRPAWSRDEALQYIIDQSGRQLDPRIVEQFLALVKLA